MNAIRVVIVDDHAVFQEGLRALLSRVPEIEVVAAAATTDEAVETVAEHRPDVVLMDLHLPGDGGITATSTITKAGTAGAVLVLTVNSDSTYVRRALRAGARGYLLKDAQPDDIIRAILSVHYGQFVSDAGVAGPVLDSTAEPQTRQAFPTLTQREYEVLERLARGLRNDAIAARLGISVKTVQNTVSAIFLKLGARDRAQAGSMARDAGIGSSP
ncbi:response regulator transcription factor [Arthrobacter sp. H35-D1]|uniref:response regulator transcription factor n=1 Tax=Arthrobacter sp. H35-D1 TaxID=3046202 RepID=UPI0024BBEB3A|nr:response regulator transcription factor [Arthrobacter sp. H35-D1]MDJ0313614.1 response regulator transcription factor [Arthrobacter sp. H35-D1]